MTSNNFAERKIEIIYNYAKLAIKTDSSRMRPKKSEVDRLVADNSKSKKLLNWSPKYSGKEGFKKGLIKTIDWFENNLSKINYKPHIYNL